MLKILENFVEYIKVIASLCSFSSSLPLILGKTVCELLILIDIHANKMSVPSSDDKYQPVEYWKIIWNRATCKLHRKWLKVQWNKVM